MKQLLSTASAVAIAGSMMLGLSTAATADQVFNDDVIISFSLCVGNDCVNGESFGFDTIRLKENNLRIGFDDTSNSASFPRNDWEIEVNSSNNGGEEYFAIDDVTGGRTPFRVQAGAPTGSLWIDSAGDVGIGQQTPITEVHITSGDTPTIRLEQDGTSGFTAQTYDIAANETNFFIRDVTNGSRLGFRMRPGAPESSIDIAADGDVGMGTGSPQADLHIRRSNNGPKIALESTGTPDRTWEMVVRDGDGEFAINDLDQPGAEFVFVSSASSSSSFAHGLTIVGSITTSGTTCGTGCDAVFEEGFALPTIEEHAEAMFSQGYLPNVGPTIENAPINLTDKVGRMLNELETAHIYIAQLNDRIVRLEGEREH